MMKQKEAQTGELDEWHANLQEGPSGHMEGDKECASKDGGSSKKESEESDGCTSEEGIRREQEAFYGKRKNAEMKPKKERKRKARRPEMEREPEDQSSEGVARKHDKQAKETLRRLKGRSSACQRGQPVCICGEGSELDEYPTSESLATRRPPKKEVKESPRGYEEESDVSSEEDRLRVQEAIQMKKHQKNKKEKKSRSDNYPSATLPKSWSP